MRQTIGLTLIISVTVLISCGRIEGLKDAALSDIQAGRFDAAIEKYRIILQSEHDNLSNLNNLGWIYFKSDSLDRAEKLLKQALSLSTDDQLHSMIDVNLRLTTAFKNCKALLAKGNYQLALDTLLTLTRSYQTNELGNKYLALCYEGLNQPKLARENWEKIVNRYVRSDVRNHYYLLAKDKMMGIGVERIQQGDFADAIEIFRLLLTVEPDSAATLNSLGWALFRNEEWKAAKDILENTHEKATSRVVKDSIETNLFMVTTFLAGEYSLSEEDFQSALTEFQKVTERYERTDMDLKYLALCYEGLEQNELAQQCWQKIIDMYKDIDFQNVYKESEYENKYYELAKERLSKYKVF